MTPRFVAVLASLLIAALAYLKPEKVGEALARGYVALSQSPAPGEINMVVTVMPYVFGIGAALILALDLILFTRRSYREFRDNRVRNHGEVIKDARSLQRKNKDAVLDDAARYNEDRARDAADKRFNG